MSEETTDVEMESERVMPFDQLVRCGFPQGNIELKTTTATAMMLQSAFMTGGAVILTKDDAELKAGANSVGVNCEQMLMLEIIPMKAQIIQVAKPSLIIPPHGS